MRSSQHQVHQALGFGAGDQHAGRGFQLQAVEFGAAQGVLERIARGSARDGLLDGTGVCGVRGFLGSGNNERCEVRNVVFANPARLLFGIVDACGAQAMEHAVMKLSAGHGEFRG